MSRTFVVSDTHTAIKYGDSPNWAINRYGTQDWRKPYGEYRAKRDDRHYVNTWNSIVSPEDTVIHLGDVIWDNYKLPVFDYLNGKKILVLGNHDNLDPRTHRAASIPRLEEYFTIAGTYLTHHDIIFSHKPITTDVKDFPLPDGMDLTPYTINIHGHFHYTGVTHEFLPKPTDVFYRHYTTDTPLTYYSVHWVPIDLDTITNFLTKEYVYGSLVGTGFLQSMKSISW